MNDETKSERIEPELEARIVALVMGEASDFEREQLTELLAGRADLQAFHRELITLHDLLTGAATRESFEKDEAWRLPEQRRRHVMAVISSKPDWKARLSASQNRWRSNPRRRLWTFGIVATLVFVLGGVGMMRLMLPMQYAARVETMRRLAPETSVALETPAGYPGRRSGMASPQDGVLESVQSQPEVFFERGAEEPAGPKMDYLVVPTMPEVKLLQERDFDFRQAESAQRFGKAAASHFHNSLAEERAELTPAPPQSGPMMFGGVVAAPEPFASGERPDIVTLGEQKLPESASQLVPASPPKKEAAKDERVPGQNGRGFDADFYDRSAGTEDAPSSETAMRGSTLAEEEQAQVEFVPREFGLTQSQPLPAQLRKRVRDWSRAVIESRESLASEQAFSTFSLHVSDVSFKLAAAALSQGQWPDASTIRIEEFVNALDYGDPMPSLDEKIACEIEQAVHPFLQQRNLLRVSMRTAAAGRAAATPLRLTCLLDNSGSMERFDRQQTVRRAFALLAAQLQPNDKITLISFARQPRLLADRVSGEHADRLVKLIDELPSEGGTNLESALILAFEKAGEQYDDHAQNRIVLLTDGAVNLGNADPQALSKMIIAMRDSGIAFDAAGIVADGLSDDVLERLTRQGDGRYYLLDAAESADDGFAKQIAGALRPAAKNVKVQIEFNPQRVGRYRLLGFEKHRLEKEDFRDDSVDAAELAAEEAGVAVYQFEPKTEGSGDVGSVSVRFRDVATGRMIENRWPIAYQPSAPRLSDARPEIRIASVAALLAIKLRGEDRSENIDLKELSQIIAELPERYHRTARIQQLQNMIQQAMQIQN